MHRNSKPVIAKNVRILREREKLTREQLSLILGFENSYISKPEKERINITVEKLDKLAEHFNIKTEKLLSE